MKIALVHDYLREYGGAERVVEALHDIWPEAPLYTSFVDWKSLGSHADRFKGWDIRTSWVQRNPIVKKFHSPLRFLAPNIWESFDLSDYDVVLSSSGWFMCRGVIVKPPAVHICYIHHPPRNLYGYATGRSMQKYPLVRAYATVINFFMRQYDYKTAQAVHLFVANSKETARRVMKFYRRESTVIYPPVGGGVGDRQQGTGVREQGLGDRKKKTYYLSVGRLVWAKQTDVIIQAANRLKVPLKIVGAGPDEEHLRLLAGPTVEFVGAVSDEALADLYSNAKATIFCALDEDFGMVPIESMAHGTPVIALRQGGVQETVVEGETGVFFDKPTVASLAKAIGEFAKKRQDWSAACVDRAQTFGIARFTREIQEFVNAHAPKLSKKVI